MVRDHFIGVEQYFVCIDAVVQSYDCRYRGMGRGMFLCVRGHSVMHRVVWTSKVTNFASSWGRVVLCQRRCRCYYIITVWPLWREGWVDMIDWEIDIFRRRFHYSECFVSVYRRIRIKILRGLPRRI